MWITCLEERPRLSRISYESILFGMAGDHRRPELSIIKESPHEDRKLVASASVSEVLTSNMRFPNFTPQKSSRMIRGQTFERADDGQYRTATSYAE